MQARIFKQSKSVVQSGLKKSCWKLIFVEDQNHKFIEPLMHRISSLKNQYQIVISFNSKESAIQYAKKYKLPFDIIEQSKVKIQKKSYLIN